MSELGAGAVRASESWGCWNGGQGDRGVTSGGLEGLGVKVHGAPERFQVCGLVCVPARARASLAADWTLGWGSYSTSGLSRVWREGRGLPCRQRMTQIPSPVDGQHRCAGITCSIGEQADSRRGKGVSRERCYSRRLTYAGLEPGLATAAEGCRS